MPLSHEDENRESLAFTIKKKRAIIYKFLTSSYIHKMKHKGRLPSYNRRCISLPRQNVLHYHSKYHCCPPEGGIHGNVYSTDRLHGS